MREYSSRRLWSTVGGKVVIPEAIADYLESFQRGGIWTMNDKENAARRICNVGWGHWVEGHTGENYDFGEDYKKYRNMFGGETRFHILRALMDGYLVHTPRMAVKLGNKFVKEVVSNTSLNYFRDLSEYLADTELEVVLVDEPVFFSADQAESIVKATGGEIVNI